MACAVPLRPVPNPNATYREVISPFDPVCRPAGSVERVRMPTGAYGWSDSATVQSAKGEPDMGNRGIVSLLAIGALVLSSVVAIAAFGAEHQADDKAALGPNTTFSGCLLGGKITKIRSKDIDPERCDTVVNEAGVVAKYVVWNASGVAGPQGERGPQGPRGLPGAAGEDGEDATILTYFVKNSTQAGLPDARQAGLVAVAAWCDPGDLVSGGGFYWTYPNGADSVRSTDGIFTILFSDPTQGTDITPECQDPQRQGWCVGAEFAPFSDARANGAPELWAETVCLDLPPFHGDEP